MKRSHKLYYRLLIVLGILILIQLACSLGGSSTETAPEGPDYAATEQALQQTQSALDAEAQQPVPVQPEPEPTEEPEPTAEPTEESPPPDPEPEIVTFTSGDLIYYTDFDGAGDWEDGWIHFSLPDSDYTVYKDNGVMYVEVPETKTTVYLFYDNLFFERDKADVFVEAGFENRSTHNINNISVMCRATDQGWYEFSILSGGLWYIYRYETNTNNYRILKEGGIANLDYDAPHTIAAECLGDQLTFYFDGEPLKNATIKDTTYREGQIGFSVYAADWADVIVEFDYFGVMVP